MMKISPLIRKELERIIRIDHAGELGAKIIYNAQIKFTKDENQSTILRRMLLQELEHLDYFLEKSSQIKARPSFFNPLFSILGKAMGGISGIIGKDATMGSISGIESAISEHYEKQIQDLNNLLNLDINDDEKKLINEMITKIKSFQSDEISHHDEAIHAGNDSSFLYKSSNKIANRITKICVAISSKF
jgi:ubiquinone biosynthesis monooxygenase Coq7